MAEAVVPASLGSYTSTATTTTPSQHRAPCPHGRKRAADTPPESEQRLSKRFDLLNLVDHNGTRLYIPVPGSSDSAAARPPPTPAPAPQPLAPVTHRKREPKSRPRPVDDDDCMQVEDTPHRVYIHDLAAELSDIESDEENPIFLSDIEKHLAKIPKHILVGPEPKATKDNQLVLYNVPTSLTVAPDKDNVRKAIVEARARLREQQANPVVEPERVLARSEAPMQQRNTSVPQDDPDAMEID